MIEVQDMHDDENSELLASIGYGHLACSKNDQPYVVPIHYAYAQPDIYLYTTDGKKTDILRHNPRVCLQVEDVRDNFDWKSVVVYGEAVQISDPDERAAAIKAVMEINPTLTPAISVRWMDSWVRENIEVVYRITPTLVTGRKTVDRSNTRPVVPRKAAPPA